MQQTTAADPSLACLDTRVLTMLRGVTDAAEFGMLIGMGLDAFHSYCSKMRAPGADAACIRTEAHKLKGSCGTLGMVEISRIASWIEQHAGDAEKVELGLDELGRAFEDTRRALAAWGVPMAAA